MTIGGCNMQKTFTITCYGKTTRYPERKRAAMKREYLIAMAFSDGSERGRYTNIYLDLESGRQICTDD